MRNEIKMIYVCLDDTDNLESRGTGKLSRTIANELSKNYPVYGVTRHQLYKHPEIPYTSHNTCSVIHIETDDNIDVKYNDEIFEVVKFEMMADFIDGSDPGLAVAHENQVKPALMAFGNDAKNEILNQQLARGLAKNLDIRLEGLGGTEDGVIGAMAGIGLAHTKNDGRFLLVKNNKLKGSNTVETILDSGVDAVYTIDGCLITEGLIVNDSKLTKPCPINGEVILFVEEENGLLKAVNRG
jgi:tRNA(Ile2) C34 agmatinyltransferase TiaS